jgi:hypothetical protein
MSLVSFDNVKDIFAVRHGYTDVSDVETVYLSGRQFLKFTYFSQVSKKRETVCISSDVVLELTYHNTTPELKTAADVLTAYKEGRLVGY